MRASPGLQEHYSNPSIGIYTVFNEGWGQFDTQRIVQEAKALDPSRLWDAASGWIDPQDGTAYPAGSQTAKIGDNWGINHPGPWMYHYAGYVRLIAPACMFSKCFSLCADFPHGVMIYILWNDMHCIALTTGRGRSTVEGSRVFYFDREGLGFRVYDPLGYFLRFDEALTHVQVGDLRDDHNYPNPIASGATATRANVAGEFGGLGTFMEGHTWVPSRDNVFKAYPLMDNTTQYQVCPLSITASLF